MDNKIVSMGVLICLVPTKDKAKDKYIIKYRAKAKAGTKIKELLKNEIDHIARKYKFENIITISFAG